MLNTIERFLEMLFPWNNKSNSRNEAKSRLQVVIAHDRACINPDIMRKMREEILDVVARYAEVDRDEVEFSLSNDRRLTSLTANLPIRQVKRQGDLQEKLSNDNSLDLQGVEINDIEQGEANA